MAVVAQLVPTPIPANTQNGAVPGSIFSHVTITSAGGAGTYTFPHNLQWTPTFVWVVPQLTEGTTPTATNAATAWCFADTTATLIGVNLPGNGTYHVIYG